MSNIIIGISNSQPIADKHNPKQVIVDNNPMIIFHYSWHNKPCDTVYHRDIDAFGLEGIPSEYSAQIRNYVASQLIVI